jgi:hypothetical protein
MRTTLIAAAFLLSGCATAVQAPVTPTPADVAAASASLVATNLDPETYFENGAALVVRRCHAWFDALTTRANDYLTASNLTSVAGAGAAGLLGLSGAGPAGIAISGIASGIVSGALGAAANSTGIAMPVATGALVEQEQDAYLAALPSPQTIAQADLDLDRMASLCSQRGAQWIQMQALMGAQVEVSTVASTPFTPSTRTAQPVGPFTPPNIRIVPPPRVFVR